MSTNSSSVDRAGAEKFAKRLLDQINSGYLALMIGAGHQTGLFDAMAMLARPASSRAIADQAGLNERYVREWLGGMTVGGITTYDPGADSYALPPEHAVSLTRSAGLNNLAPLTLYLAMLGEVEPDVVTAFREGGGVPYSRYPRFQALMAASSRAVVDSTLVERALPMISGLVRRLEAGIDVADVGCGSGHAVNVMARAFPNSRFKGFDISERGIAEARKEAEAFGLANATFEVKDVSSLDGSQTFDFITAFDAIHDQAWPRKVLSGISRSLREDGIFLMVDIAASSNLQDNLDHRLGPMLYTLSTFHCMTVSLAEGGEGLGTVWGEGKARELLAEAGFKDIEVGRVEGDGKNSYYIARK